MRTVLILLMFSSTAIAQTTYYVNNVSGSDSSNGLTSATAKKTILNAIATASTGDIISVAATDQIYTDSTIVSKPLTFTSTNGNPQLAYFKANLSGLPLNRVTLTGGFLVQMLVLSVGKVQGSDSLTIIANGKVVRGSDSAQVLQQLKFAGRVDLEYTGSTNITMGYEVPATDSTIKNLTLNFDSSAVTPLLTLNRNLFVYNVNLTNGLLVTGPYYIHLDNPIGKASNGYIRNVQPGYKSHVIGNVRKTLKTGTIIPFGRNEFPVGNASFYRPVAITFSNFANNQSLGINVIVSETNQWPTGIVGLPIANGVSQGIDIARYPNFYWSMKADSTYDKEYTLELTAQDFMDYDDIANVRIIRRRGTIIDVTNTWTHSGTYYDNFIIAGIPTVVNINQTGGITKDGNIFTYGLRPIFVSSGFPQSLCLSIWNPEYRRSLVNPPLFTGAKGTISYSVSSSNPIVATASIINNDTLIVTLGHATTGFTRITITGIDSYDGSRISVSTIVYWMCPLPSVPESENDLPPTFSLSQNYPNPFNPTTTIEFALPQSQFVKLTIYNMFGGEMETLVNDRFLPGRYKVDWNASSFNTGIYFYRLQAGNFIETKKLILLK